jgi:hypothetical protein
MKEKQSDKRAEDRIRRFVFSAGGGEKYVGFTS